VGVVVRAFRGTRRSSVYREHVLSPVAFGRIVGAARDEGLGAVAALAEVRELDKDAARRLGEEASRLRVTARILDLDDDLTALAAVANWCARASEDAWLRIAEG
jgi:hypothetical protein